MKTVISQRDEAAQAGIKLKALHDAELVPFGDRGETRPRSRGQVYDIPPTNGTYCPDKVDQTGADYVDLNALMKKYQNSGQLQTFIAQQLSSLSGQSYADFTDAPSYEEAMNTVAHANEQFELLDASIRNRFVNDPAQFLAFVSDPKNKEELYTMGLAIKPPVSTALSTPAAPAATPSPAAPAPGGTN